MDTIMQKTSHEISKILDDLYITECGKEKCSPIKDIHSYAKDYHVLHYIQNGKGYFEFNGIIYTLYKGDMFYIPPNQEAHYYPDAKEPWTYTWFGFNGEKALDYLDLCHLSPSKPIFTSIRDNSLNDYLHELVYSYNRVGYLDMRCLGYVYIILAIMIEHAADAPRKNLTAKESHVKEAKEFISYNFQFPITVKDIADSVNLTTNYLSNIFQETLGLSPKQYLTKYRMDKACSLLMNPKAKVKDVALAVGYANQLHFSGEFKKNKGLSPKNYQDMKFKKNKGVYSI